MSNQRERSQRGSGAPGASDSAAPSAPFRFSWVHRASTLSLPDLHPAGTAAQETFPSLRVKLSTVAQRVFGESAFVAPGMSTEDGAGNVYWASAWSLATALSVAALVQVYRPAVVGAVAWTAVTLVAFMLRNRTFPGSVGLHLFAAFPAWLWLVTLRAPSGLPYGHTLPGTLALLGFPVLLLVAFWGSRGAVAGLVLTTSCAWICDRAGVPATHVALAVVPAFALSPLLRSTWKRAFDLERAMRRMAALDPLTGVANRQLLYARANAHLAAPGSYGTVLCVGLNRFKAVNESLGRPFGDELLRLVARRLVAAVPSNATVARLGGDEFVVFAAQVGGEGEPRRLAKILLSRLRDSFCVEGHAVHVGARVGVAVGPRHGSSLDALIHYAEAAMHRAKERSNAVDELSWHGLRHQSQAILLEAELRVAIAADSLAVEFQPICDTATGRVVGAEALARWSHPELGAISPADFIPLAEEGGFVSAIDEFVRRTALRLAGTWVQAGWDGWIAINLSAESVSDPRLPRAVQRVLRDTGVPPERLVLELTESRAMHDPDATVTLLHELKSVGVAVALDDFGMGYSSLAYLKTFPIDHLKIDRSFVCGIGLDDRDEQLIDAVLELAHRRGVTVVAEGVESEEQHTWLVAHRCEYVQGYRVGRSMGAEEFAAFVGVGPALGAQEARDGAVAP